jgi:hypothetical protein
MPRLSNILPYLSKTFCCLTSIICVSAIEYNYWVYRISTGEIEEISSQAREPPVEHRAEVGKMSGKA